MAAFCLHHRSYAHLKKTVTIHGLDVVFPNSYFQQKIIPKFNSLDKIFAVSDATALALRHRGITPEKIVTIPNGVDSISKPTLLIKSGLPEKYIVAMGRAVKRKGFSWFVKEVVPLLDADIKFLMIGPFDFKPKLSSRIFNLFLFGQTKRLLNLFFGIASDEQALRKLLNDDKYSDQVTHLGKLPLAQVQQIISHANAFVMPNIPVDGDMEGFGLVSLEASLLGATVFASNLDGIPSAIQHDKNGILLRAGDASSWAEQLNAHCRQNHYSQASRYQAFTKENYSWSKMVQAYITQFEILESDSSIPGTYHQASN